MTRTGRAGLGWEANERMRIKHWQGYGCVNAKRTAKRANRDGTVSMEITVTGMHECGLERNDVYDVHRWLLSKFAKDCASYRDVRSLAIESPDDETAVYRIVYAPSP